MLDSKVLRNGSPSLFAITIPLTPLCVLIRLRVSSTSDILSTFALNVSVAINNKCNLLSLITWVRVGYVFRREIFRTWKSKMILTSRLSTHNRTITVSKQTNSLILISTGAMPALHGYHQEASLSNIRIHLVSMNIYFPQIDSSCWSSHVELNGYSRVSQSNNNQHLQFSPYIL